MIRVLVADDHAVVRRGVVQILDEAPDMIAAGQASTGREVLQALRQAGAEPGAASAPQTEQSEVTGYDVLVLDIAMPDLGGLEVLQQLQVLQPELPVLILSMYPEKQYALRALRLGAAGYLTKDSAPDELIGAIRRVARGGRYVTQSLAETLADHLAALQGREVGSKPDKEPHENLSDREFQVMCALARGQTVSLIAAELSLSVKTVSTYRSRVLTKLGLSTTAEIMRYAIERGLVE
jgi:DNA-binding NarL/FixJ family response regulator